MQQNLFGLNGKMEFPVTNEQLRNMRAIYEERLESINMQNLINMLKDKILQTAQSKQKSLTIPGKFLEGRKQLPYKLEDHENENYTSSQAVQMNFENVLSRYYTRYTFEKCEKEICKELPNLFPDLKIRLDLYDRNITFDWS